MIPLATTTITIKGKRPQSSVDPDAEGYDPPAPEPEILATGIRAAIATPEGMRKYGDSDEQILYALRCDPVDIDLTRFDTIVDENTDVEYRVSSAQHSHVVAFGLDHIKARLYLEKGLTTQGGESVVPT